MSIILQIIKAKPNPVGKDKLLENPNAEQLLSEWVDIKNVGNYKIKFPDISLSHTKFNNHCQMIGTDCFWMGDNSLLQSRQILRIHIGRISDEHLMKQIDKNNCDWHSYAGRNKFVLNNNCGDTLTLTWRDLNNYPRTDTVSYDKNQPEETVLIRVGNKLISGTSHPAY